MSEYLSDEQIAVKAINESYYFDILVQRYHLALCNFIFKRFVRTREQAEDIVQEAWIRSFLHLKDFDPSRKWKTWIFQIAINCACNALRDSSHLEVVELNDSFKERLAEPQDLVEKTVRYERMQKILASLDQAYRKVLEMHYLSGWSCEKIAGHLKINSLAVKAKIKYAERAMLVLYRPEWRS